MKSKTSWEEEQRALDNARVLADFANMQPSEVERFKTNHSDFVPKKWWDHQPTTPDGTPLPNKQWQIAQKFLRDAWLFEFNDIPLFDYVHLLTSVFNPDDLESTLFEKRHRPAFAAGLELGDESPYHLAVKWLAGQSWRVRTCLFCEKRFIREHPKTKFCSFGVVVEDNETTCFWAHRKKYKNENWDKHKDSTNRRRRREYQRSSRANRKNLRQG